MPTQREKIIKKSTRDFRKSTQRNYFYVNEYLRRLGEDSKKLFK